MQYSLVKQDENDANLTVFVSGADPQTMHSSHPNFDEAVSAVVLSDDDEQYILSLFDLAQAAATRFETLTERVSVADGRVYFDGDEVDTSLTRAIVRFLDEGEDFDPLVNFFENVQQNPNEHSRTQLYNWLNAHDFTIDQDGHIVGYKGIGSDGKSQNSGIALVDGEVVHGRIPNPVGACVEMPRSQVEHDPATGCSTGLHVGTYDYAQKWASGAMLRVSVNPRDVVSVPTDASGEKVRVCRYVVQEIIDAPVTTALFHADEFAATDYSRPWRRAFGF